MELEVRDYHNPVTGELSYGIYSLIEFQFIMYGLTKDEAYDLVSNTYRIQSRGL